MRIRQPPNRRPLPQICIRETAKKMQRSGPSRWCRLFTHSDLLINKIGLGWGCTFSLAARPEARSPVEGAQFI